MKESLFIVTFALGIAVSFLMGSISHYHSVLRVKKNKRWAFLLCVPWPLSAKQQEELNSYYK